MSEYKLEIKQLVDYPRCRIYREFVQTLIADRSIRTNGCSGLFCYTILCSYANFRTSYRRLDGISYTIYPGEWVCRVSELSKQLRFRFRRQTLNMLDTLQDARLLQYSLLGRGQLVKYKITDWRRHNTVLDYNCPCQKDTGFFFLPVNTAKELVSWGKCSEMDILLDLWISAVYHDDQVQGSFDGPVAYFRNGTGNPLVSYSELALRWGLSKSTVGRILKKFAQLEYIDLFTFPGRHGTAIYLRDYLSTMFKSQMSWWIKTKWLCHSTSRCLYQKKSSILFHAFQTRKLSFQNRTANFLPEKSLNFLRCKGFNAHSAASPAICYILYPTTARV